MWSACKIGVSQIDMTKDLSLPLTALSWRWKQCDAFRQEWLVTNWPTI